MKGIGKEATNLLQRSILDPIKPGESRMVANLIKRDLMEYNGDKDGYVPTQAGLDFIYKTKKKP